MRFGTDPESALSQPGMQMEFRQQMRAWRKLLAHCGRKPGRKSVHNLRVATLRLQAALEFSSAWVDASSSPARSAQRWVRQAKKLRRALGPVRQADVSLGKLATMRDWAEHPASAPAALPKEFFGAIEKIERTVTRRRKAAAKKLVTEIERRHERLNRLSRELKTAPGCFASTMENGIAERIQSQIAAAGAGLAEPDPENLHKFRKRIKKIRYLAEMFAPLDSSAAHQASMLKRMTAAIGEWHDWQALAEEAARIGGGSAAASAVEFLQARARRSFQDARMICIETMDSLINHSADGRGRSVGSAQTPRKPVASVSTVPDGMHAERSVQASKLAG